MQDSVTVHIDAPPEAVWALVSDVTQIGKYSPETFEAEWLDGATGPAVGAKFRGHVKRNGRGPTYWAPCTVVVAQPNQEFAFTVGMGSEDKALNRWGYVLEPSGDGTDVTESFRLTPTLPLRIYWALLGWARGRTNRNGMQTTLDRMKAELEGAPVSTPDRVALVTGASRGIGKACAVELAKVGYDVAISARTVSEGEAREHSSTVKKSDTRPLPGSLATTAELIQAEGRHALPVAADLTDRATLTAAAETVLDAWGRVDVLVNNGRYIGPGHMDRLLDTPIELLDRHLEANALAPLVLIQALLPPMLERGSGLILNMTSDVAWTDPPAPAGEGGWGLGYAMSKGALHRVAGILAHEVAGTGVHVVNVSPGFVATERMVMDMAEFGFDASMGATPTSVGVVVAWLATDDNAAAHHGSTVAAQELGPELGLTD